MKIKSNAAPIELSSPFYKINEDFCFDFEKFVASKNGHVKGNYNAWSYFIQGKILAPKVWHLKYKKAIYSSTGNLILSSKYQNLLTLAEWSTPMAGSHNSEFSIFKKEAIGIIGRLIQNAKPFKSLRKYVVINSKNNPTLIISLYPVLEPLFQTGEIYSIILKKDVLTISLRTDQHHFEVFENLLKL